MAAEMQDMVTHWKNLKTQAESGELKMDPDIGNALKAHAEKMRGKLDLMLTRARALEILQGFGGLDTANTLRKKFEAKATGADGSALIRLQQSIEILTLMSETYAKAIGTIQETDLTNAQKLGNAEAEVQ
ncbi:hypothetical protein ACWEKT_36150 [Nocardia takedensis]|uniref:hypothetical protein n=1 Tax=Nocardia takedensis TaxID=259390 RepID=UPI000685132A|nr:hypothetical protein [Nocardia takedensis]